MKQDTKQRVTAFIDPLLLKRAKVRGAIEDLTISEVVEQALEAYAPKIEKDTDQQIHLKFTNSPAIEALISQTQVKTRRVVQKHTKALVVPR